LSKYDLATEAARPPYLLTPEYGAGEGLAHRSDVDVEGRGGLRDPPLPCRIREL
jgi:hypothetical protein